MEHKLSKLRKIKAKQITIKMTGNFEKPSIKISFLDMVKLERERERKKAISWSISENILIKWYNWFMDQVSKSLKKLTRILDTMLQIFLIQKRKIITNTLPPPTKRKNKTKWYTQRH